MEVKRYALAVEYDGHAFNGWQIQPDVATVQGEMERAVGRMAGHSLRVHAAGRTDAGVHATRQIVHFDTAANRPITAWVRGVNSFLPDGVSVLWAKQVPSDFHSRFVATARHYRYLLLQHPIRPSLWAGKVGWIHNQLDLNAIKFASQYLLGEHDFSSFRAAECQALSPVKKMLKIEIGQQGDLIYFDFSATAFLHHMVRNMMGALLHIGKGNESAEWMAWLIEQRNRSVAPPTFMPDGLYLTGVSYPEQYALPTEPEYRFGLI
ncbi:tRNA pseudouridine(38-40) synthase TruA [Chitinibacter bivalviorum]|uniref:tRNA pseudouridine synthase A n=1 Tax=Chitinibacter bivalviorum TaxID=2739434 RepID=A0A7H9BHN3_9NEIS|nr:tRNA pseudouridine(38-40) synthase TruA [Chitinibacter bivalviorum]QLG87718.1 tRNA pseudouridine(38-40) synthase TruA [Chitinibacter bivalviorum]